MVDLVQIEKKWQKRWLEKRIFEPKVDKKKKKYFVTIPYPYTSGPLHLGHARAYGTADVFVRYRRMTGLNVFWPMAYHVTGTPVLAISSQIERGDEKTIKLFREYIGLHTKNKQKIEKILKSFIEPENVMSYFASTFIQDFNVLGCSIDWRRQFTTNDNDYNKFVEWQFNKLNKMKLIKKGEFPVLFCPKCNNAVGVDDIKGGDEIKPEVQEWHVWKFPFKDGFLVCATLRPETIYGVTNLWINPNGNYVKAKVNKEIWYVGQKASDKLRMQNKEIGIIDTFDGKELLNLECKSPVSHIKLPILAGSFVDPEAGTGIVYSVPAHAPFDYAALKDIQRKGFGIGVEPISILTVEGYSSVPAKDVVEKMGIESQNATEKLHKATEEVYKAEFYTGVLNKRCGSFSGKKISDVKDSVVKFFMEKKKLDRFYEVNALEKPVKCRDGTEIVVSVLKDQWFLDYGNKKWKALARKCLKKMEIIPKDKRKMFEDTIEWLHEKPVARTRGLGTKLPMDPKWIIESLSDSTIYMSFYTVVNHIRSNNIDPMQLTDNFWNYILLGKGKIDAVEKETGIKKKLLKTMKEEFNYWYPVDLRHTSIAHITNHLSFYIFNHAAIFPQKHWPKTISLHDLIIREGRKMSKSLGNVISVAEIPIKYSTDLFRLYLSSGSDLSTVMDFRESDILVMRGKVHQFYNLVASAKKGKSKKKTIDKWLISRFNSNIAEATKALENYRLRTYVQHAFFNILNDIVYYRRTKDDSLLIKELFPSWIKLLSPVIPHICEELWYKIGKKGFVSMAEWPKSNKKKIDKKLETSEDLVSDTTADISEIIKLIGKEPKKITIFVADDWKAKLMAKLGKLVAKGKLDFKSVIPELMKDSSLKRHGKEITKIVPKLLSNVKRININALSSKKEKEILKEAKGFLKEEFDAKIEIILEKQSKEAKAKQAMPGKPAIIIN